MGISASKVEEKERSGAKSQYRARQLVSQAIDKFKLKLDGLTILTEAASGNYIFTPLIAALAGAKKVYAITKNSRYASLEEVTRDTMRLAEQWGITGQLEIHTSRKPHIIHEADIVTNLGFVRPIDKEFVSHMKETAVVPLMFETWEYRESDLDLAACRERNILVLGTNEKIEGLEIFGYIGNLAMKLAFELDIEVFKSKVAVVGGGYFGDSAVKAFLGAGASVVNFRISEGDGLATEKSRRELSDCDLLVFVEHQSRDLILGKGGQLAVSELLRINPGVSVVHIAGNVDEDAIRVARIPCRPSHFAPPGYMSLSTDYLGPRPVIDLHTAGLKVGELMARARVKGLGIEEAKDVALRNLVCQDFPGGQRAK